MRMHRLTVGESHLELGKLVGLLTVLPIVLFAAVAAGVGAADPRWYVVPLLIWLAGALPPAFVLGLLFAGRTRPAAYAAIMGALVYAAFCLLAAHILLPAVCSGTAVQTVGVLGLAVLFCGPFVYAGMQLVRIAASIYGAVPARPAGDFACTTLPLIERDLPESAPARRASRLRIGALCVLLCLLGVLTAGPGVRQQWLALSLTKIQVAPDASSLVVDGDLGRGVAMSTGDSPGDQVTLFDTRTHRVVRRLDLGYAQHSYFAVFDARDGHLFLAVNDDRSAHAGWVWMLDASTGTVLRRTAVGGDVEAIALDASAGRLYAGTTPGSLATLATLDTASGELLRSVFAATACGSAGTTMITGLAVDTSTHHVFELCGDDGSPHPGSLAAFDGPTGKLLWVRGTGIAPEDLVVDSGTERVFVADTGEQSAQALPNTLETLDARTGRTVHTVPVGEPVGLIGDPARRRVLLFDQLYTGSVSLLSSRTGIVLHRIPAKGPSMYAISNLDEQRGLAFLSYSDSSPVSVLDLRSGKVIRTIDLDAPVSALAIDEQGHQLFGLQADQNDVVVQNEL